MNKLNHWRMACIFFSFCAATAIASPAQNFKTLASFDGTGGAVPYAGLMQGTDGNFFGTTYNGGTTNSDCAPSGCGMVFKITAAGKLTTLYTFCSQTNCTDGAQPYAGLLQASDGNFYGTTQLGGNDACTEGCGTVFKLTPGHGLTTLHSFNGTDGFSPYAPLVRAADGNFYGTTGQQGDNTSGTVFKITPAGKLTTLYTFCSQSNCADGADPWAGLVQGTDGSFYGTTSEGGTHICRTLGTHKIGCGTVFKISSQGKLTKLYNFCSRGGVNCTDGVAPLAGLVQAADGNFYGTTSEGGANAHGTVFKITAAGKLTTLYSFCSQTNCTDGSLPQAALVQATSGRFYGTTSAGGASDDGTVFELSVGLGPFVQTLPTSGKVGAKVIILGDHLSGTTSVSFNGTAADFKVIRSSEITTTVPAGATGGTVEVTTPKGKLTSNVAFRVMP